MTFPRLLLLLSTLFALTVPNSSQSQSDPVRDKYVEAQLISSVDTIAPGQPFTLGLKFSIDPTWHTYWINPGPAGKITDIALDMPNGFKAGELKYPVPKKFVIDYGYNIVEAGYGYEESVIHPITITPPADLKPGDTISISGTADWLMCDPQTCVPGKADLKISLEVGEEAVASTDATMITFFENKLPQITDWPVETALEGDNLIVTAEIPEGGLPEGAKLALYPYDNETADPLADATFSQNEGKTVITIKKFEQLTTAPDSFTALIVADTGTQKKGYKISTGSLEETEAPVSEPAETEGATITDQGGEEAPFGGGIFGFLLAAFLGGMILNIMPCVFPVISLKVMSFVGQAGEDRKKVLTHALVFTLGILVFFWALAVVMIAIDADSWGFQFQEPGFVIFLIFVMVVVALSLFGVFEIGTSMTAVGGELTNKSGYSGSFWSGALAVLLATPCTAPLMAPAITFALNQSAAMQIGIFTSVGLGMAAPYFVLSLFPKLLDMIPPPGPWMETFKQAMGFPMIAVAIWLIGVLSRQLEVSGLQWALVGAMFVAIAAWILGRYTGFDRTKTVRTVGRVVALAVFAGGIAVAFWASGKKLPPSDDDIAAVVEAHRNEGKHVFVDFTAEWCATCKVNERTSIKTDEIQKAFKDNNIEFVVADYTTKNPKITEILQKYDRSGVPLYLLYPADKTKDAIRLNDGLVTKGAIYEAIEKLPN